MVDIPKTFTDRECGVYQEWMDKKNKAPLSVSTSLKMYELYLNGYSCEEIFRLNDNQFPLGMILEARIRDSWDDRREQHLTELYGGIVAKVKKTQTEAVAFVADLLAAAHKKHGDKLKKFLQSGNPADLGALSIDTMTSYQTAATMLLKLTGQDKQKDGSNKIQIVGQNIDVQAIGSAQTAEDEQITSGLADKILQFLESKSDNK